MGSRVLQRLSNRFSFGAASLAGLLALAASAESAEMETAVRAAPATSLATRQTLFVIPFEVSPAREPSCEPVEVQLYVSADEGETWELSECVEPSRGHFLFRAGGDGEYWFLIRTLDRSGRLKPREIAGARLQVVVDTMPPWVQIEAERGPAGEILLRWTINEPHPGLEPLRVQYRTGQDAQWSAVAIPRRPPSEHGSERTGQITWWPPSHARRLEIRAEVRDRAGNSTVSHAQVRLREDSMVTVHSRHFALNYAFPDGQTPDRVEIWTTLDHGRTWHFYGVDGDRRTPATVTVDQAGTYGFRIIARDQGGHGGVRPRSGDRPDISICVLPSELPAGITSIQGIPSSDATTAVR